MLKKLIQYRSYFEYDFESEAILVADGDEHAEAYNLYAQVTKDTFADEKDKWAFDIALDCVRNMTDEDVECIKKDGEIPNFHFGYGMHVRNKYVHPSKSHTYFEVDDISSSVEKFIYTVLTDKEIV